MSNKYLFRIAPKKHHPIGYSIVKEELYTHGHLRQGWGGHKADLAPDGKRLKSNEWIEKFTDRKMDELDENAVSYYEKIFKKLVQMLDMKKGDILIVPKLSYRNSNFRICKVVGEYRFAPLNKPDDFGHIKYPDDFGHVIPVKVLKSKNNLELDIESIQTIEQFFRKGGCIVPIRKTDVIKAIDNLVDSIEPQQESTDDKDK